ncbi:hypothetical protein H9L39_17406 [Fusarium oxysporum f. sp. albedinis]|nr:hypothetical protein H9L39_17406 [Fusarium oxysporum f. sp. albedinis]
MNWAWTQIQVSYALAAAAHGDAGIECRVPKRRQTTEKSRSSPTTSVVPDDISLDESTAASFVSQSLPAVPVFADIEA